MRLRHSAAAIFFVCLVAIWPTVSGANTAAITTPVEGVDRARVYDSDNCWRDAGNYYRIDPWLLYAVAWVESKMNPGAINFNEKTHDLGLMQINSSWLGRLGKYGITEKNLKHSCVSIYVGAWILAHNFHRMGFTWQAIGAYNARDPYKRLIYANKVYAAYDRLKKINTPAPRPNRPVEVAIAKELP